MPRSRYVRPAAGYDANYLIARFSDLQKSSILRCPEFSSMMLENSDRGVKGRNTGYILYTRYFPHNKQCEGQLVRAGPRRGTLSFVTQKFFCFGAINNRRNIG